jgi:hypothetical protein
VVEVDTALIIPTLDQVGAVMYYLVQLHHGREELKSAEAHRRLKLVW